MTTALVTGGGGFLGGAIVRQLLDRGDSVRSFARGDYPALRELGVDARRGDLGDADAVSAAVESCDVVYHVAAKAGVWGPYDEFHRANVTGTENVITACRRHGVPKLVFTSSPSVVHGGGDIEGADESLPYPASYESHYPHTKAIAERAVLAANGDGLATTALRPHLVWGPGDRHIVPRIVGQGRKGQLRRIGRRPCLVDHTFVDDGARAHLLAADRLEPGAPPAGRAYFISQGRPVPVWDLANRILEEAGVPPVTRTVPVGVAVAAAWLMETTYRILGRRDEPRMTRFVARQLSTAHWFDISAARRDLDYEPQVSLDEGMRRLRAWIEEVGL
jgi:nucleoside-diphosphate-sugar epimerase